MSVSKRDVKIQRMLKKIDLVNATKVTDTLQGSIWRAYSQTHSNKSSVIKVTDQFMHQQHIAIYQGKQYPVDEDIVAEQSILKHLTESENCPQSVVKFHTFFKSSSDYYLVMEDGGVPLFDFVLKSHRLIKVGDLDVTEWQRAVKVITKQMIECVQYLHSNNVAHFDISLENFLISDVKIQVMETSQGRGTKIRILTDSIQIKLCDFGLAELFTTNDCMSNKFCGKKNYKSPECAIKTEQYDAKKNDIWCLGVCLFMMMMGTAPWKVARESDAAFVYVMNGKLVQLLTSWNIIHYADPNAIDLFGSIFQYESDRMCLQKLKQHPWFSIVN